MESKIKIFSQKWWINNGLNMYNKMKLEYHKINSIAKYNGRNSILDFEIVKKKDEQEKIDGLK